jgi:hypothetical protein
MNFMTMIQFDDFVPCQTKAAEHSVRLCFSEDHDAFAFFADTQQILYHYLMQFLDEYDIDDIVPTCHYKLN